MQWPNYASLSLVAVGGGIVGAIIGWLASWWKQHRPKKKKKRSISLHWS